MEDERLCDVRPSDWYFGICVMDDERVLANRGTAFPVADGTLVTCRHVVDIALEPGTVLGVYDGASRRVHPLTKITYPDDPQLDLALLPDALPNRTGAFPLLDHDEAYMGTHVQVVGYVPYEGGVELANFQGAVVRADDPAKSQSHFALPFAAVEGLSGSPVIVSGMGGPIIGGVVYGSEQQRVLAAEVIDVEDDQVRYRETTNRIVEFGRAYSLTVLRSFLDSLDVAEVAYCPTFPSDPRFASLRSV